MELPTVEEMARSLGTVAKRPHIHAALLDIGKPGSRFRVATPAAIVDLEALDRNIARMAADCRSAGISVSPHAKSHKSAFIARRQFKAGAARASCAKVGEAEALFSAGIDRLLITTPIVEAGVAARAATLARDGAVLLAVADHRDGVAALERAARGAGTRIGVLVDVDVGDARTGVLNPDAAAAVARDIASAAHLELKGVQGYGGFIQHKPTLEERRRANRTAMDRLRAAIAAMEKAGHQVEIRSGGGTGSFASDVEAGVLNDVQPGSYIFMDREYRDSMGSDGAAYADSLFVQSTVISVNAPAWVSVDAGVKAFATNGPLPPTVTPPYRTAAYHFAGDEFGQLDRYGGDPPLGTRIEFQAPHCDPTVDHYDVLHMVVGNTLVAVVPVEGRGRSQ